MRMSCSAEPSSVSLGEADLNDPRLYGEGEPHLVWHALRERAPVHWQNVGDGGYWSVTKYDDVSRVLRDHETFTSQHGTVLGLLGVDDPARGCQMEVTDPPRHTQMRVVLQRALTGPALERHRRRIEGQVRELLRPAMEGEAVDFAAAMLLLSTAVAGLLMELPEQDWPWLCRLSTTAMAPDDPEYRLPGGRRATLERTHRELFAYFQDLLTRRRRSRGDDLVSLLCTIEVDGRPLSSGAIVSNCYSLLLGANVTSPHVPSAALLELIENGGYEDWARRPECLTSGIEEALRWASPASHFMRYATRDVEVRGTCVKAGEAVVAWLGSANRDAEVFPDPYAFDVRRHPNRHLAFGTGPHFCVGHAAARLTLQALFPELFRRFDHFELAGPVRHLCSNFVAGIARLPLVARRRRGVAGRRPSGRGSRLDAPCVRLRGDPDASPRT